MGTSRSPAELAAKLDRAARELQQVQRDAVNSGARVASDVMYREAMRSIGGPNIVGRKWGTMVKRATSPVNPQAVVQYRGPVHWFESGTKPHTIISKKYGGSRRTRASVSPGEGMFKGRKRGAVLVGGQPVAYAKHPGTQARPFFDRAKDAAVEPTGREIANTLVQQSMRNVFR